MAEDPNKEKKAKPLTLACIIILLISYYNIYIRAYCISFIARLKIGKNFIWKIASLWWEIIASIRFYSG